MLKELSHGFGFELALPHTGTVGSRRVPASHRLDETSVLQLAHRALDALIVQAGQPRLQSGHIESAVEQDQDEPLALGELV